MAWVSPTGYNDPDTEWADEGNAYDEDTDSYAYDSIGNDRWGSYLELTHSAIDCDKVRFWAWYSAQVINEISIDVYYESDWHNIYEGAFADGEWVEKSIPAGTKSVTKARVKFYNEYGISISCRLYEFDFNEVTGGTTHYGAATFSGTGALAALAKLILTAKATASGAAALSAAAGLISFGAAVMSGAGSMSAAGSKVLSAATALTGAGSLSAVGRNIISGVVALAGVGALAAAGTIEGAIKYGAATLSGSGALAAAGVRILVGAATMAGAGSLAAAAVKTLSGAATLAGVGSLSAVGNLLGEVFGAVTLAGLGSLSVIAESWHILTSQEYQDLLEGQIEFQEI